MYYYRYDGNILDFTRGPLTGKILKMADNCFIRERKDRITLFSLKLTMVCPGTYREGGLMEFFMLVNKKKSSPTCDMCYYGIMGRGKLCTVNSFLLPGHFHHKKANFNSMVALLRYNGYLQLPVPDPLTWSYMNFRY
ncbi:hypothetical protein [Thermosediminibacter litoriperuensis]|uniref:Uncharacterized protein n=1 Tax=Thermosediminibacter litoriperuensis TaxID=291989 RepID=A0A5S5AVB8_9FIRM|nr:hypothetical protein [Thermosediminibacter litoriperuensis]TYP56668.1 hypothetical protein LZ11_00947 [Thermosediminibacter litoriperuensis]